VSFFNLDRAGNVYVPNEDGHFVSENQRRVAAALADYDPNLQLQWIPPGQRDQIQDNAFRVVDVSPGRSPYVVCFSNECDERLLARVFAADNTKGSIGSYLDAHNAAIEAVKLQKRKDSNEEANRMAFSILRSRKEHYKHNGFDFGRRGG
jgi:hypothetical protein